MIISKFGVASNTAFRVVDRIRDSFWAIPIGLLFSAGLLAVLTLWLDTHPEISSKFGQVVGMNVEAISSIRSLLSTTAAAVLGVAGVSFSITIASLTLASQQFGPRLIRNFIRNRFIQTVLGVFIATFFYCMLIMQLSATFGDEIYHPVVSLLAVLLLTLLNLVLLVLFIHHICVSIQVDSVINEVFEDMEQRATLIFSEKANRDSRLSENEIGELACSFNDNSERILSVQSGYITYVYYDKLKEWAEAHDAKIHVLHRAGDHVFKGSDLLLISAKEELSGALGSIEDYITIKSSRTPEQDLEYTIRQLVEIALRALSPGINDPFTAMTCIDRLGSLIHFIGNRSLPPKVLVDSENVQRLLIDQTSYESLVGASFNQLRQNAKGHVDVTMRLLETLTKIVLLCASRVQANELTKQADLIMEGSQSESFLQHDLSALDERYKEYSDALKSRFSQ